jgi:putative ABC transport system substrate-binding protein
MATSAASAAWQQRPWRRQSLFAGPLREDLRHLLGLQEPIEARGPEQLEQAFSVIGQDKINGMIVQPDGLFFNARARIAELALMRRLPTMVFNSSMVESGGLMTYAPSSLAIFRRAGAYVDKILKGTKPVDLPVELPTRFELVINLKTAKTLGLTIPPTLLSQADKVIE